MSESIDELRDHWDAFAPIFEERMEPITRQTARTLLLQLALQRAQALLEVGAGAGGAALEARELIAEGARHVVTDLSPEMVRRARAKLPDAVEVQEADVGALPFDDGAFDRYLANLNLMLVPDADLALREAARVVRPGGLAAWCVWGRREHSPMFTIPPRAAERAGIPMPDKARSNFYLGDRDALREKIAAHGFEKLLAWYQPMPVPIPSPVAYAETTLATPRWKTFLEDKDEAKRLAVKQALVDLVSERLDSGLPLQLEALLVVGTRS